MKFNTCGKYHRDPRVPNEDLAWLGRSCGSCLHCNAFTGCQVSNRGKDAGDGRTYISDSGKVFKDEED